jgi:DnaJ-class molecular chaperone
MNYFGQKFVNENTCQACQGWGKQISKPCPVCGGKKIVTKM